MAISSDREQTVLSREGSAYKEAEVSMWKESDSSIWKIFRSVCKGGVGDIVKMMERT